MVLCDFVLQVGHFSEVPLVARRGSPYELKKARFRKQALLKQGSRPEWLSMC